MTQPPSESERKCGCEPAGPWPSGHECENRPMTAEQVGPYTYHEDLEYKKTGQYCWKVEGPKWWNYHVSEAGAIRERDKLNLAYAQGRKSRDEELVQLHAIYKNVAEILEDNLKNHGVRDITQGLFTAITNELLKAGGKA